MSAFQSPNFWFLEEHDELLLKCAAQAERLVFTDPNAALFKVRLLGELLAQQVAVRASIPIYDGDTAIRIIQRLDSEGILSPQSNQIFHILRKAGNKAVHNYEGETGHALDALRLARRLAVWFHRQFGIESDFEPGPFLPPPKPQVADDKLLSELEELRNQLAETEQARNEAIEKAQAAYSELSKAEALLSDSEKQQQQERLKFSERLDEIQKETAAQPLQQQNQTKAKLKKAAKSSLDLSESETRALIDDQLRDAGWEADSKVLTFQAGVRPQKGRNIAIAEWPVYKGRADYVLFAGLTPIATVEAKKKSKDVSAALKQAQRYCRDYRIKGEEKTPQGSPWGEYVIPFAFSTNGRPYLKQLKTKSGIWFRDCRVSTNLSRAVVAWHSPEGLKELLAQDIPAADNSLAKESSGYLDIRYYQHEAIRAIETAISNGQRNILTSMATGTGKTRTCIGLVYRLCKAKRFRRVLFLVDRSSLGVQTADAFKDLRLESSQTFADIYDVKELGDVRPEKDTRFHIATIQGMIKRLLYPSEDCQVFPIDQYDCVIVDECHRGYNLDRELSDSELLFRSEQDYISKYSRVLDYFDAVRIGLTATPALHTTDIFGPPVYNYSYRQAVIDGYLVDHEPPVRLVTELAENGIIWKPGDNMDVMDGDSGEIETWKLEDEVKVEIEQFNKMVITKPFNKVICESLTRHIDPDLEDKTLIFCATDEHADMVVDLLKQAFAEQYGEIEDDAIVKITGKADKPLQQIRHFKNERNPSIVVTVDLLTTGIDVPKISNLVFLRKVRSRILYEQMMGRATRLCDAIGKESFRIFDAVDLYSALQDYSTMKPVVQNPNVSFSQLLDELKEVATDEIRQTVVDQFRAKFQRKKRLIAGDDLDKFVSMTGDDPENFAKLLGAGDLNTAVDALKDAKGLGKFLDRLKSEKRNNKLISYHEDRLLREERGYGEGSKPEDYLESFKEYIKKNKNEISALKLVLQRPRELTRQQLKELKLLLDEHGYSEVNIRTAWREATNQDIAASIIGFIRQLALGSPLIPYEQRVERAMKRILESRAWTVPQRKWLERIGKQLHAETIVDREALNSGQFQAQGGFNRLNKVFDGRMDEVLGEINDALWQDAG